MPLITRQNGFQKDFQLPRRSENMCFSYYNSHESLSFAGDFKFNFKVCQGRAIFKSKEYYAKAIYKELHSKAKIKVILKKLYF